MSKAHKATLLKLILGETLNLTLLPCTKLYWPHQPCSCLTWLKLSCHQLCLKKKMDPKAEQNPQSHFVKTYIGRNFKSYPITIHKIVLTWSATWLFKTVMSSTVPGKKSIPKLSKAHKAKVTVTFIKKQNIQVLTHPPYSPNLAPSDFWLFRFIKEKLAGQIFSRIQDSGPRKSNKFGAPCISFLLTIKIPLNLGADD